ncbi:MAG TPA: DUF4252 domain-containing protein [Xanthomonadales bacterium]|nr:DUF4252 domain-containing protein [Xanthomonadales bacterium]
MSRPSSSQRMYALPRWALLGATLCASLCLGACGLTAPKGSEGFAELDSPGVFNTDNSVTISIGPTLLRFAAAHLDDDDQETRALLRGLDGVRIRVYEIERNPGQVANRIDAMQGKLLENGWEPVMLVRDKGEVMHLLAKFSDERILGLTLLAMEEARQGSGEGSGEVVVINLMGEIQPQSFSNVMVALNVDNKSARNVKVAHAN